MNKEMFLYAARNPKTGKFVSDITNPRKKFWQKKEAAKKAICYATSGRYRRYESLELVTFKLVEVDDVPDTNVGEWISVKDRLPDSNGYYLTYYGGNCPVLSYSTKHKLFNTFDEVDSEGAKRYHIAVTHWMSLPQPPKGE